MVSDVSFGGAAGLLVVRGPVITDLSLFELSPYTKEIQQTHQQQHANQWEHSRHCYQTLIWNYELGTIHQITYISTVELSE